MGHAILDRPVWMPTKKIAWIGNSDLSKVATGSLGWVTDDGEENILVDETGEQIFSDET